MYQYFDNCVNWDRDDVHCAGGLCDLIDSSIDITRKTFLKHIDRGELKGIEELLGYSTHPAYGLIMANDWAVSYHRSKLHGNRVYYFRHSAIEYVFTNNH